MMKEKVSSGEGAFCRRKEAFSGWKRATVSGRTWYDDQGWGAGLPRQARSQHGVPGPAAAPPGACGGLCCPCLIHFLPGNAVRSGERCSVLIASLRPHGLYRPWNSPGQNSEVGSLSLLQGIFPTHGSNLGLLHCRQILYQLSHKGRPRILEWVAYPFSSGSSGPRNWTGVSWIAGMLRKHQFCWYQVA